MKKLRVLVFPCGAENAIEIFRALRYSLHVDLFGLSSIDDHGAYCYSNYSSGFPNISHPDFDGRFVEYLKQNDIDLIFPTHDTVAEYLAERSESFGAYLINGDPETARILRSKRDTYELFANENWCPDVYGSVSAEEISWPVVVKPDRGQGAQSVHIVSNRSEAVAASKIVEDPVVVEYLPGSEITVDCFTDRKRKLVWVGPRTRERVRAGISMRSRRSQLDAQTTLIASSINDALILRGPWFFQIKQTISGQWKLLEASCRVSGTMIFQRAMGVNLPLMTIHDFMGRDLTVLPNDQVSLIDRCISTRMELTQPYNNVFVDLDDTLVIDGTAVPVLMAFLYQCVAAGKKIYLLTRHDGDPIECLRAARISPLLFDEIYHIQNNELKSDYISESSVFIDNHFPERFEVSRRLGIPALDVDAVQLLTR